MSGSRDHRRRLALSVLLALTTLSVYLRTASFDFISYDDPRYVQHNDVVQEGLTVAGVTWAFATHGYAANWHPLTWLSHMLDVELFGGNRPGPMHLHNALLHAAATVALFLVLTSSTGESWPSAWVAALFALHPQHVESVAWIAERKDVLSALLGMLTLAAWVTWVRRRGAWRYAVVLVIFALGLMAKPVLVTLPLWLLLLDFWPLDRWDGKLGCGARLVAEKLPLLALTIASSLLTYSAQQSAMRSGLALGDRAADAAVAYLFYLRKSFVPTDLAVFYPHWRLPQQAPRTTTEVVLAVTLLAVVTVVTLLLARRGQRAPVVGWLWFLGTTVPMSGLVKVGEAAYADRYTYLPHIGLFVAVAWGGRDLARRLRVPDRITATIAVVLVLASAGASHRQIGHWRDDRALFGHTAAVTSNNALALTLLATAEANDGDADAAIAHLERAAAIDSVELDARRLLGRIHLEADRPIAALRPLREALALSPDDPELHYAIARAFLDSDQRGRGLYHLGMCLASGPSVGRAVQAHRLLAREHERIGDSTTALEHWEEALRLRPGSARTLNRFAWFLATDEDARDPERAVDLATKACAKSEWQRARHVDTLAAAHSAAGDHARAAELEARALALVAADDDERRAAYAERLAEYQRRSATER